jgi:hypothetical protein
MGQQPTERQADLWAVATGLPQSPGHAFYDQLNDLLAEAGFHRYVKDLFRPYDAEGQGRDSTPPGGRLTAQYGRDQTTQKSTVC